jgi:hypothetical protein
VQKIHEDFNNKRFCTATFIDISQAFDEVWHPGLLYKLKRALPHPLYSILKSYPTNRVFQVRYQEEYTSLQTIHSGVPQGSILSPILYSIFTADLPVTDQNLTATYADDTATLASHTDPIAPPTASGSTRTLAKSVAHTSKRIQINIHHLHPAER